MSDNRYAVLAKQKMNRIKHFMRNKSPPVTITAEEFDERILLTFITDSKNKDNNNDLRCGLAQNRIYINKFRGLTIERD